MSQERGAVPQEDAIVSPPDGVATAGAPSLLDNPQRTPRRQFRPGRIASVFFGVSATVAAFGSGCTDASTQAVGTRIPEQPTPVSATKTPETNSDKLTIRGVEQGANCEVIVRENEARKINGKNYWDYFENSLFKFEECVEADFNNGKYLRRVSSGGLLYGVYLRKIDKQTGEKAGEFRDGEELFTIVDTSSDEAIVAYFEAIDQKKRAFLGESVATVGRVRGTSIVAVNLWEVDDPACDPRTATPVRYVLTTDPQIAENDQVNPRFTEIERGAPVAIDNNECELLQR